MINLINKRLLYRQFRHSIFTIIKNTLLTLLIIFIATTCTREWNNPSDEFGNNYRPFPFLSTTAVANITGTSAVTGGNITYGGSSKVTSRGICYSTISNPIISNNHTTDGTGTGNFISNITNLTANTTYYVRAYATNSNGTAYGYEKIFKTNITGQTGTLTDVDGNTYNWVGIGKQAWMAENLKVTKEADGTVIPFVTDNAEWANLGDNNTDKACCYYNNSNTNRDIYGALYTYVAAKDVCPTGWHLPTDDEWTELEDYISNDGHFGVEGTALKATSGWYSDGNGTDDYGFFALPGGSRHYDGTFFGVGDGVWWSSTEDGSSSAWYRDLYYQYASVGRGAHCKSYGFSVRCVRDN